MTYYNTTNEKDPTLFDYEKKAESQEEIILNLFKRYKELSPTMVEKYLQASGYYWPITSIRRAISNLSTDKLPFSPLTKTNKKTMGNYRRLEYIWKY